MTHSISESPINLRDRPGQIFPHCWPAAVGRFAAAARSDIEALPRVLRQEWVFEKPGFSVRAHAGDVDRFDVTLVDVDGCTWHFFGSYFDVHQSLCRLAPKRANPLPGLWRSS